MKEENQLFYTKCLDYVLCIQELEEKWFHFFSESIFAFTQSWSTFYHESYDKHIDCESRFNKSHGGIQALRNNLDYFKSKSKELILDIIKVRYDYDSFFLLWSPNIYCWIFFWSLRIRNITLARFKACPSRTIRLHQDKAIYIC